MASDAERVRLELALRDIDQAFERVCSRHGYRPLDRLLPHWVAWEPSADTREKLAPLADLLCREGDLLVAGGAVAHWAMDHLGLARPGAAPPSDIDVFVLSPAGADAVGGFIARGDWTGATGRPSGVVDLRRDAERLPLQFIYGRLGCTPDEVLRNFDLDYVCVAVRQRGDLYELGVLPGAHSAWRTGITSVVNEKTLWVSRLDKAKAKGFLVKSSVYERCLRALAARAARKYLTAKAQQEATFGLPMPGAAPVWRTRVAAGEDFGPLLREAYLLGARQVVTCLKSPLCVYWHRDMRRQPTAAEIDRALQELRSKKAAEVRERFLALCGTEAWDICFPPDAAAVDASDSSE